MKNTIYKQILFDWTVSCNFTTLSYSFPFTLSISLALSLTIFLSLTLYLSLFALTNLINEPTVKKPTSFIGFRRVCSKQYVVAAEAIYLFLQHTNRLALMLLRAAF